MRASLAVGAFLFAVVVGCDKPVSNVPMNSGPSPVVSGGAPGGSSAFALSTEAGALKLTPDNTKIEWTGTKPGGQHVGGFKQLAGTVDLAGNDPTKAKVAVEIETDSIFSDQGGLTNHLKGP